MDAKERIDQLRIQRKWSLYRLSQEIGVSSTTVYSWYNENNFNPSRKTIADACIAFGISESEFYSCIDVETVTNKEALILEIFRKIPDENKDQAISILKTFISKA